MDWRLVGDFVIRNFLSFLVIGPTGLLAGFYDWPLYFLLPILFMSVATSIDEFFTQKPHRVIRSLGLTKGNLIRTTWFENVLLPATLFALVYWLGALASARGIQMGSEQYRTLLIAVLWICILQSACLIFCLASSSELLSRVFLVSMMVLCLMMASINSFHDLGIGWPMVMVVVGLTFSFAAIRHDQYLSTLIDRKINGPVCPTLHQQPSITLLDRAMSHPHWFLLFAIVGASVFGFTYSTTLFLLPNAQVGNSHYGDLAEIASPLVFCFIPFLIPIFLFEYWRQSIRAFKTLPISTGGLFLRLMFFNLLLASFYCVLLIPFARVPIPVSSLEQIQLYFMVLVVSTGVYTAISGLFPSSPEDWRSYLYIMLCLLMGYFGINLRDSERDPVFLWTVSGFIFFFPVSLGIHRGIQNSSEIYRNNPDRG